MTVLLVLLFIILFIGIDIIKQHAKKPAPRAFPEDAFIHDWGVTMADGGQKIKEKK